MGFQRVLFFFWPESEICAVLLGMVHMCVCVCVGGQRAVLSVLAQLYLNKGVRINAQKVVRWVFVGACGLNHVRTECAWGYLHGAGLFHIRTCENGSVGSCE